MRLIHLAWTYVCCTLRSRCLTLALRVKESGGGSDNLTFWTVKYTHKDGGLISAWRGLEEAFVFLHSRPSHRQAHALWHSPPGWNKRWVCVWGEALNCLRMASTGEGESRGANWRLTYSRWTALTTKATEGNAFCAHRRYFTKLQEEKRAEFKWELGKLQLFCLEAVLSLQYSKKKKAHSIFMEAGEYVQGGFRFVFMLK